MKKGYAILIVVVAIVALGAWVVFSQKSAAPTDKTASGQNVTKGQATAAKQPSFNKNQFSIDDPTSVWVVVNKQRPLSPKTYVPADLVVPNVPLRVPGHDTMRLRASAAKALEEMVTAAKADGVNLMLASGYRSYDYQVGLYNGYVNSQGQAQADAQSARPGYSEHQTGLALDLRTVDGTCELDTCFGATPEGRWLAANGYKYGFIIRYPEGSKAVVGYEYEPWHVRYVGKELAADYHRSGVQTLEQYLGLPAAPDYAKN